jgi:hypothetical protein
MESGRCWVCWLPRFEKPQAQGSPGKRDLLEGTRHTANDDGWFMVNNRFIQLEPLCSRKPWQGIPQNRRL